MKVERTALRVLNQNQVAVPDAVAATYVPEKVSVDPEIDAPNVLPSYAEKVAKMVVPTGFPVVDNDETAGIVPPIRVMSDELALMPDELTRPIIGHDGLVMTKELEPI